MRIEAWPLEQAQMLGRAHIELYPGHRLTVYTCADCTDPIGIGCDTCTRPICAITTTSHDTPE